MAIWQYQLYIIPKEAVIDKYGEIPEKLFIDKQAWKKYWENIKYVDGFPEPDFEDATTMRWWRNINLDIKDTAAQIDKLVKRADWSNAKDYIGWKGDTDNEEDNDCHISFDEITNEINEFQFRIDLRNKAYAIKFIDGMLEICAKNNLYVMNINGYLFAPDSELILEDIKKSDAEKFLTDPGKLIRKVAEDKNNRFQLQQKRKNFWERLKEFFSIFLS